eukprot:403360830
MKENNKLYLQSKSNLIIIKIDLKRGQSCSWQRQLCVLCFPIDLDTDSLVIEGQKIDVNALIRVISNGMLDHCFSTDVPPVPQAIDFLQFFNPQGPNDFQLNGKIYQKDQDSYLCNTKSFTNDFKGDLSISLIGQTLVEMVSIKSSKESRMMPSPVPENSLINCDMDVCNGRMMGSYYCSISIYLSLSLIQLDQDLIQYGYVATDFFPYLVGFWGPGSQVESSIVFASCSNYPRQCPFKGYFAKNSIQLTSSVGLAIIALLFNTFA